MNKILKLSAIALLASSTSLMAQSKNFAGASVGIAGGMAGVEITGSSTDSASATTGSGSFGKITAVPSVNINYGFEAGSNFVFGVGADYIPGEVKFGTNTFSDASTVGSQTDSVKGKLSDVYSVYVTPTYVINKDSAVYAKLGYVHGDVNLTSASSKITIGSYSKNLEGWAYGIGSKTMLTNNLYLTVEGTYTEFDNLTATTTDSEANSNTNTAKPKVAQATIGLGYKF
jgi:opacity protein-like surface antigen